MKGIKRYELAYYSVCGHCRVVLKKGVYVFVKDEEVYCSEKCAVNDCEDCRK